jgi:hypothetical protein
VVIGEDFGTQIVPLPLGDPFWILSLELESFFFVPFPPLWWVLCLMVFAKVSSFHLGI